MKRRLIIGLFLSGLFLSGYQPKAKTEERKISQTYLCHQSVGKIKIDGLLDEKDWQKAESISFYHLRRKGHQDYKEAESPAIGKLLWDKDYLYISIEAKDKDIWATIKEHDGRLWQEDVLEAFFKPDRNRYIYYEFEFSPKNVTLDLMMLRRSDSGAQSFARSFEDRKSFESDLKSAVKIYGSLQNRNDIDDKWVLEAAIPLSAFKEISLSPKIGDEWSFALCRYDYSVYLKEGVEHSSTAKLSKLNFHLWEDYDWLLFSK